MNEPSAFAIVANGFAEGPAQALRDYLADQGTDVIAIAHPLTPEDGTRHVITRYRHGERMERTVAVPFRPPLSFALDPFVPLVPPRVDTWFGFNPLACARGLAERAFGRARRVVLWSVDFVPDRFGTHTPATAIYDRLDHYCCLHTDGRVELSAAARDARNRRHALPVSAPPTHVVPMGAWLDRVPTTSEDGFERRRVVFLGHLAARQGVAVLLEALALLARRGESVDADVVGRGPLEKQLRDHAGALALHDLVRFHGFVADHSRVERLLAAASLGVAPYVRTERSFTRYADPGKLKAYVAAGLPVILTDVPPNAQELVDSAGAEVVGDDPAAVADAIARGLSNPYRWRERRAAALAYARGFDWATLLPDALEKLELTPRAKPPQ
jgi:glycosyltransferase involved in cell wall biosynthesis